ncbi:MAG TPA: TetR/AcrR family transcriptional regulator [Anaerolineales bacterium]|nr:TetR/AcrR family transcriptional regulator [Anaerolineales bacterium]
MNSKEEKKKKDRRIQRTRQALRAALLDLLKEKRYDDISIEEITERANVGRATFYLHYKDKEDLLLEEFSEMANERARSLAEIPFSAWFPSEDATDNKPQKSVSPRPLLMVFQHIKEHADMYYILLKSSRASRNIERIRKISIEAIVTFVQNKLANDPIPILFKVPVEFFAAYFSGALLSAVEWWLEEGMQYSPEEMTLMFRSLFFHGARETLGLPAKGKASSS